MDSYTLLIHHDPRPFIIAHDGWCRFEERYRYHLWQDEVDRYLYM